MTARDDFPPLSNVASFDDFYWELHGHPAFPWQMRAARKAAAGEWPDAVELPTGSGKSSLLDIALWAQACQAHWDPTEMTAPRKIIWATPRRALVDEATGRAEYLVACLEQGTTPAILATAERLRSLSPDGALPVLLSLRGGLRNAETRSDFPNPAQPAVFVTTVPMLGSRLLARPYGQVGWRTRSVHASIAVDSLLLLDEAHLIGPLRETISRMSEMGLVKEMLPKGRRFARMVAVSATHESDPGIPAQEEVFRLDDDDLDNEVLRERINAQKTLEVRDITDAKKSPFQRGKKMAAIVQEQLAARDRPTAAILYCNDPNTAREAAAALNNSENECRVLLATGRMRPAEAAARSDEIKQLIGVGSNCELDKHVVVVATQTLEVGADLDVPLMVIQACGAQALVQRLGRLNRLGEQEGGGQAVWAHTSPDNAETKSDPASWALYGTEPAQIWKSAWPSGSGTVDASPDALQSLLNDIDRQKTRTAAITGEVVRKLAATSIRDGGAPDIEPYISGPQTEGLDKARIAWRTHLPEAGERIWPRVSDSETIEIPIRELWPSSKRASGKRATAVTPLFTEDRKPSRRFMLMDADGIAREADPSPAGRPRPGTTIVIAAADGGNTADGWDPQSDGHVTDLSIEDGFTTLSLSTLTSLYGTTLPEGTGELLDILYSDHEEATPQELAEVVGRLLELLGDNTPEGYDESGWRDSVDSKKAEVFLRDGLWRVRPQKSPGLTLEDQEELSITGGQNDYPLDEHGRDVGHRAQRVCASVGLSEGIARDIVHAAEAHDIGKADPRFQRLLGYTNGQRPMAKSPSSRGMQRRLDDNRRSGFPAGGRHEELSRRALEQAAASDVVLHLVASHHGHARPLIPPTAAQPSTGAEIPLPDGSTACIDSDLGKVDWEQPARFAATQEELGVYGLMLAETILRCADWEVSKQRRDQSSTKGTGR